MRVPHFFRRNFSDSKNAVDRGVYPHHHERHTAPGRARLLLGAMASANPQANAPVSAGPLPIGVSAENAYPQAYPHLSCRTAGVPPAHDLCWERATPVARHVIGPRPMSL